MNIRPKKAILLFVLFLLTVGAVAVIWLMFQPQPSKEWLMLGNPFSGFSTFRNEEFKKTLLEKEGISLEFDKKAFDQEKRAQDLNEGKAQFIVTTLDQVIEHEPEGKIVALIDRTIGADAVVLNTVKYPELKSLEALRKLVEMKGKKKLKIAYAVNNPTEFLAYVFDTESFEHFGVDFELSDFEILGYNSTPDVWDKLPNEPDVALAVLFEPFVTKARKKGYKVIFSTKDEPEAIIDVLVASNRLLKEQPERVSKFLEVYYKHIHRYLYRPERMQEQIKSDDPELSPDEAKNIYEGIHFFTALEANDWLTNGKLEERIKYVTAVLDVDIGKVYNTKTPKDFFDDQLIKMAVSTTEEYCSVIDDAPFCLSQRPTPPTPKPSPTTTSPPQFSTVTVYFVKGSDALTSQSQRKLNDLAKQIKAEYPENIFRVIGHTSMTGSEDYNLLLSQKRANAVANYLNNLSLKNEIISEGKGFSRLLPDKDPDSDRQQRAEIRLVQ